MDVLHIVFGTIFWLSGFALVHTYLLYPAILTVVGRFADDPSPGLPPELPTVTLVIAAYNEEDVIGRKIENSLALDYPSEKLEIVVFSDASSDRTDEIVGSYADDGVRLVRVEGRVGKTECQNVVAESADGTILVFSDANSMYDPDAIRELVRGFAPDVGCVVGELRYNDGGVEGESVYWRYERYLKRVESKLGSIVTGNGSIYAVRRSAYVPLPRDAVSDMAEPLSLVENGYRIGYAHGAIARERTGDSIGSELDRRIRIVTRSLHTISNHLGLLSPIRHPGFATKLVSHKLLRWHSPVFLAALFVSTIVLAAVEGNAVYVLALVVQVAFYGLAAVGALGERSGVRTPIPFHVPYYFLVSNYGMLRGLVNFLFRQNIVKWETADRVTEV